MIICARVITLIMHQCSEVKILSIITAIFQAIGQALTFIFPISESGHSAIFHDFSSRYSDSCSELTGLIHIGIAIGILAAFYKVFISLFMEFVNTCKDVWYKNFNIKTAKNSRKFMYYTVIPYVFMLFYLIPAGKKGNLYQLLKSFSYDGNLLLEGICFLFTGLIILLAFFTLQKKQKGTQLSLPIVLILSVAVFLSIPIAGLSLSAMIIAVAIISKVNKNIAYRFFIIISVPVLIVGGIIEIVNCVTYVNIITGIVGVVIAGAASFFISKFFKAILNNSYIKYFSYYNFAVGAIIAVTGIAEIFIK